MCRCIYVLTSLQRYYFVKNRKVNFNKLIKINLKFNIINNDFSNNRWVNSNHHNHYLLEKIAT